MQNSLFFHSLTANLKCNMHFILLDTTNSAADGPSFVQSFAPVVPACVFYIATQRGKGDSTKRQCNCKPMKSDQGVFNRYLQCISCHNIPALRWSFMVSLRQTKSTYYCKKMSSCLPFCPSLQVSVHSLLPVLKQDWEIDQAKSIFLFLSFAMLVFSQISFQT